MINRKDAEDLRKVRKEKNPNSFWNLGLDILV